MIGALELAGWAILGGATVQAATGAVGSIRRLVQQRRLEDAALEVFRGRARLELEGARTELDRTQLSWEGYRKFVVADIVEEARDVKSFFLRPHDGKPVPPFKPGQHLTFKVQIARRKMPAIRCYSLSDAPGDPEGYRVTVKRQRVEGERPGLVSSWFHDEVTRGRILDVKAPSGDFTLDTRHDTPVVLIAGGVGITPIFSMLRYLVATGAKRETWFFYGVRDRPEHIFHGALGSLLEGHENVHPVVCYSRPGGSARHGADYDRPGRITVELIREHLPSQNFDFYLCGPGEMMEQILRELADWGVSRDRIHFEAFGADAVASTFFRLAPADPGDPEEDAVEREVVFEQAGRTCLWTPRTGSLLDLAEQNEVPIDSGCRAGRCGSCLTALREGAVSYRIDPSFHPEPGTCLPCIAVPEGRLVLDA